MATPAPIADQENLYALAYAELYRLARRERWRASSSATINTTALVFETWLKLRSDPASAHLAQNEFLAIAARAMRQVLVDHTRHLNADKRRHFSVTLGHANDAAAPIPMLDLDDALSRLADVDAQLARIVDLHVFSGMEFREIAESGGHFRAQRVPALAQRTRVPARPARRRLLHGNERSVAG